MLYLIGRIQLLEAVIASLHNLLEAVGRQIVEQGAQADAKGDIVAAAGKCYIAANGSTPLGNLEAAVVDAILDLAHQLHSLEEDIRYERRRLLDEEITELRKSYWIAREALQGTLDRLASRQGVKVPKLNPDPFAAELNLGLF